MQKTKNLYSYKNDVLLGTINMLSGDFIPAFVKPSGAKPNTRAGAPQGTRALQDGYPAPPAPRNRVMAVSGLGNRRVSRLRASEGQEDVGTVTW